MKTVSGQYLKKYILKLHIRWRNKNFAREADSYGVLKFYLEL